ncbi:hypothetical protein [Nostoc sp. C057]|nr:hypothetical protein [Nostoc sp. C057]
MTFFYFTPADDDALGDRINSRLVANAFFALADAGKLPGCGVCSDR